ncbi:hypothetical protein C9374_008946 [Naegleria lovaniensis]|uniref:EGF-like domain-containing protein n=1 Tax=Naegleria lovaniensis TaxID=51637 RepID=A0AA88KH61_NAELO|nr:uncharacterized protein C9374_008946 [Naegleria lovaniensis]KAG2377861.1 hypothetical protein C9374_008946 [Naegleria lovaniensis]
MRVRKVDLINNIVSTVFGTGYSEYSISTPGLAVSKSTFLSPTALAWWKGKLLVGESYAIRQIDMTTGIVSFLAGSTNSMHLDDPDPSLARFSNILCLHVASNDDIYDHQGNILALDQSHSRVRKITNNNGVFTTVNTLVGVGGVGNLMQPYKMSYTSNGDLYITHQFYISKYSGGVLSDVVGNGQYVATDDGTYSSGTSVGVSFPTGISVDSNGAIYFVEAFGSKIRKFNGTSLSSIIDSSKIYVNMNPANRSFVSGVRGKVMTKKEIFIIVKCNVANYIAPAGADGLNGPAVLARFNGVANVALDDNGDLYIAESGHYSIKKVTISTGVLTLVAGDGSFSNCPDGTSPLSCGLNFPRTLAFYNEELYFSVNNLIRKISRTDNKVYTVVGGGSSTAENINGTQLLIGIIGSTLEITSNGLLYFVDNLSNRIKVYDINTQKVNTFANTASYTAYNWALLIGNDMYFGTTSLDFISKIAADGSVTNVAGSYGTSRQENSKATETPLSGVQGILWSPQRQEFITFEETRIRRMYSVCATGWTGPFCDIPICWNKLATNSSVCSGHGNCTAPNTCSCIQGYSSLECTDYTCYGLRSTDTNVCSGNGDCSSPDNCTCRPKYMGDRCQEYTCFGLSMLDHANVCNGKGFCLTTDVCLCSPGYSGLNCSNCTNCGTSPNQPVTPPIVQCFGINSTEGHVCSGHGNCSSSDNCTCETNFYGSNCSVTLCFGVFSNESSTVCSGNGTCNEFNSCTCHSNNYGNRCEYYFVHTGNNSTQINPPNPSQSLTFLWFILPLGLILIGIAVICCLVVIVLKLKKMRNAKRKDHDSKEKELNTVIPNC